MAARLPIRWRLTLMFGGVMAVLLAGLIAFLYLHFRSDLDYNIDQSLRARAQDIAGLCARRTRPVPAARCAGSPSSATTRPGAGHARRGAGLQLPERPIRLSCGPASSRAARSPRLIQRGESLRLYALPLCVGQDRRRRGIAGRARRRAGQARQQLALGVPPALLLATLAAYVLAAAALRPVERMRARASTISTDEIGTRLPLPDSRDEIRRLGITLNAMLDRLEEGLHHERLFIANASHELRMPLAVLKAELEVSLRERGDAGQLRAAMRSAIEETDRIVKLAEDLLLLARAEDGTLPIAAADLPIEELLFDLGERFSPIVADAGASWSSTRRVRRRAPRPRRPRAPAAGGRQPDRQYAALRRGHDHSDAAVSGDRVEIHVCDEGPASASGCCPGL